MNFWQNLAHASMLEGIFIWLVLIFVGGALGLMALKPNERVRIRNGLFLFVLSFLGLLNRARTIERPQVLCIALQRSD